MAHGIGLVGGGSNVTPSISVRPPACVRLLVGADR